MSESLESPDLSGERLLIVDSWPVLEWIYGNEPAASSFRRTLEDAAMGKYQLFISRINYGEVTCNVLIRKQRGEFAGTPPDLSSLPWTVVSVDDALVDEAVLVKATYPISFADCFAVALAQRYKSTVLTGDPDFQRLAERGVVQIEWLGA